MAPPHYSKMVAAIATAMESLKAVIVAVEEKLPASRERLPAQEVLLIAAGLAYLDTCQS